MQAAEKGRRRRMKVLQTRSVDRDQNKLKRSHYGIFFCERLLSLSLLPVDLDNLFTDVTEHKGVSCKSVKDALGTCFPPLVTSVRGEREGEDQVNFDLPEMLQLVRQGFASEWEREKAGEEGGRVMRRIRRTT